jgi:myo-inositol-1(or 4)-monophosphatase
MYTLVTKRYNKELNDAVSLAHLAGSIMLHYYDLDYDVSMKEGESSPEAAIFTEVDGKVDRIVNDYFSKLWPGDQLLTEETNPDEGWYKAERIWIIDPIDGTMGYKKKTGSFGISMALVEDGRPALGVLYAPVRNLMAWAVRGEGAYLNGMKVDLHDKSSIKTILCSSNSIDRPQYGKVLQAINPGDNLEIVATESVVVKALLLLNGSGEIYPILPESEETKSVPKFWDIAAADIILHEAGGRVTNFFGEEYKYDIPDFRCVSGVLMGTAAGHSYALSKLQTEIERE